MAESILQLMILLAFCASCAASAEGEDSLFQNFVIDLKRMRDEHNAEVQGMKDVIEEQNRIIEELTDMMDPDQGAVSNGVDQSQALQNLNSTLTERLDGLELDVGLLETGKKKIEQNFTSSFA